MAKINTLNYQTVAAWNGSQDLFIVEQPDGTKVATPAMVKQFIEAGDFEATGEVIDGHGNILADMAKADEVKGIAEAGDFVATGEVKDGHGNILADMAKASDVISCISYGNITASSITEAIGKAWDSLTIYSKPVIVFFGWYGQIMAMMYKYPDSQYGMAFAMRYISTDIYTMSVNGGVKSYATK